jgi:uncharacterized protein YjbI with pentapeptide repeats
MIVIATTLILAAMTLASCQAPTTVLSGQVTSSASGNGIAGIAVQAYADGSETVVASARTDAAGGYRFTSGLLPDGTYRIRFGDADWYDGVTTWAAASPVAVTSASPAIVDTTLADAAGSIEGTVTDPGGDGVYGAHVQAVDPSTQAVIAEVGTNGDGTFTITDLAVGDYLVRATAVGLGGQYHSDSPNSSGADVVHVTGSADTTGVDIALPDASTITIDTYPSPGDAPGVVAIAIDAQTGEVAGTSGTSDGAGEGGGSGQLQITGLNAIGYRIMLIDSRGDWAPQVYGSDTFDLASGTVVTPTAGNDTEIGPIFLVGAACAAHHAGDDLAGANLSGLALANCDLHGVNLTGANLSGTNLNGADLTGADLTGVIVDDATDLTDSTLTGVDLDGADLSPLTSLEGVLSGGITGTPIALPDGVSLVDGTLVGSGLYLAGADLHGADLSGLHLGSTDLTGANLSGANLSGTDFAYANLTGARLDGASVSNTTTFAYATLTQVSLTGTDFSPMPPDALSWVISGGIAHPPTYLPGGWMTAGGYLVGPRANLSNADLSGTNLTAATLTQAKVAGASFVNANLSGLDLSGLGLSGADLTGANLTNATISSSTDLTFVTLTSATLTGVDLSSATTNTLQGVRSGSIINGPEALPTGWHLVDGYLIGAYADLSGANLTTAVLSGMDLSHTNLQGAALHGATVNGTRALAISGTPASLPTNWAVVSFNYASNLVGPGVDLSGANLANADLGLVDLAGANLSNATLLYGVNLGGTVLLDADLTGIDTSPYAGTVGGVSGTPVDLPTGWVVANGYLVGPSASLVFASLAGQDLTGASLAGSDLRLADFSDATGSPAGGATATYQSTTCPDHTVTSSGTCVGHGFAN